MAEHWTVGADAVDPPALARFWALALGAGATVVREERYEGDVLGHVVLRDPEGNPFCVA